MHLFSDAYRNIFNLHILYIHIFLSGLTIIVPDLCMAVLCEAILLLGVVQP